MSDLRVIQLDVQAETAEEYIHAAAKRFGEEFFVPTDEVFGDRVRIEAPFLGGSVGVRGEALATPATRDGRKGYVVRMLELDRDSVVVMVPGPLEEESEAPKPRSSKMSPPRDTPPWMPALRPPAALAPEQPAPAEPAPADTAPAAPAPAEPALNEAVPAAPAPAEPAPESDAAIDAAPDEESGTADDVAPTDVAATDIAPMIAASPEARPRRRRVAIVIASVAISVILILWWVTRKTGQPHPVGTHVTASAPAPAPSPTDADVRPQPDAVAAPDAAPANPVEVTAERHPVVVHTPPPTAAGTGSGSGSGAARRPAIRPLPAPPTSVSPRDNALISCRSFGTEIELVWAAVPGATGYTVEVARDASFSSLVATIEVEATTVGIFRPMAPGAFQWRVRTHDANAARSEPGTVRQFTCSAGS